MRLGKHGSKKDFGYGRTTDRIESASLCEWKMAKARYLKYRVEAAQKATGIVWGILATETAPKHWSRPTCKAQRTRNEQTR